MELGRAFRELEPVLIQKSYEELTTMEAIEKSAMLLSRYDEQKDVEKEFYPAKPSNDADAKEWAYERERAYKKDEPLKKMYKSNKVEEEKKAAEKFDVTRMDSTD